MIIYNWKTINKQCNWDKKLVLTYFFAKSFIPAPEHLSKKIPRNLFHIVERPFPKGSSYLINLDALLLNSQLYSLEEIYLYLDLASRRNVFDYKMRGEKTLSTAFLTEIELEQIKRCSLIKLKNDTIYFIYEQE